jgi:uncharacterized protein YukE
MTELTNAEPIVFDAGAADDLAARFRATARTLRSQVSQRNSYADEARVDWEGVYEVKFGARMRVMATDSERLAEALDEAAGHVDEIKRLAEEEQERRRVAREWKVEHDAWQREQDDRSLLDKGLDLLGGDGEPKPPNLVPTDPPRIPLPPPPPTPRDAV